MNARTSGFRPIAHVAKDRHGNWRDPHDLAEHLTVVASPIGMPFAGYAGFSFKPTQPGGPMQTLLPEAGTIYQSVTIPTILIRVEAVHMVKRIGRIKDLFIEVSVPGDADNPSTNVYEITGEEWGALGCMPVPGQT